MYGWAHSPEIGLEWIGSTGSELYITLHIGWGMEYIILGGEGIFDFLELKAFDFWSIRCLCSTHF